MSSKRWKIVLLISCCSFIGWIGLAAEISPVANVDRNKVESSRISWHNQERSTLKLNPYSWSTLLDSSAQHRADYLESLWTTTHSRNAGDGYYNYRSIRSRFADQGVALDDESGTMFSESLGRGSYTCKKTDCTDTFIKAMKSTFTYFMREKRSAWQPHYNAIVSKQFTALGLGITVSGKKYYLVSHYGKNVVSTWANVKLAKAVK